MVVVRTLFILAGIAFAVFVHDVGKHPTTSAVENGLPKECPTIAVKCPNEGSEIAFIARVKGEDPNVQLTFQWSITRGEIKSGQGTPKIILKAERDGSGIGASVDVSGLPAECANKASCHRTHF